MAVYAKKVVLMIHIDDFDVGVFDEYYDHFLYLDWYSDMHLTDADETAIMLERIEKFKKIEESTRP